MVLRARHYLDKKAFEMEVQLIVTTSLCLDLHVPSWSVFASTYPVIQGIFQRMV